MAEDKPVLLSQAKDLDHTDVRVPPDIFGEVQRPDVPSQKGEARSLEELSVVLPLRASLPQKCLTGHPDPVLKGFVEPMVAEERHVPVKAVHVRMGGGRSFVEGLGPGAAGDEKPDEPRQNDAPHHSSHQLPSSNPPCGLGHGHFACKSGLGAESAANQKPKVPTRVSPTVPST